MSTEKIGVGITTYNTEHYYEALYNSLPRDKIDELVTVNGGKEYSKKYDSDWIQHRQNRYPSVCRNDCINFLLEKKCDHIFIIEDDMVIKDKDIFYKYIEASKVSGLKYFSFVSTSWESGTPEKRTPKLTVEYNKDISISFYPNMCNEFTYHHASCYSKNGLYDTNYRFAWDVDLTYRESIHGDYAAPFWWFADVTNSDNYIMNNPETNSRIDAPDNPDGSRTQKIHKEWEFFIKKHNVAVTQIPNKTKQEVVSFLKQIKP
jgi:hypothetical protein